MNPPTVLLHCRSLSAHSACSFPLWYWVTESEADVSGAPPAAAAAAAAVWRFRSSLLQTTCLCGLTLTPRCSTHSLIHPNVYQTYRVCVFFLQCEDVHQASSGMNGSCWVNNSTKSTIRTVNITFKSIISFPQIQWFVFLKIMQRKTEFLHAIKETTVLKFSKSSHF